MKATPNDFFRFSKIRSSRGLSRTHSLPTVSQRWINTTESESDNHSHLHPSQKSHKVLKRCRWDDFTSTCTTTSGTKNMNTIVNHHKNRPVPSRKSHDHFVSLPIRSKEDDLGYGKESTDSRRQDRRKDSHGQDDTAREQLVSTSQNLAVVRGERNHHQQQPGFRKTIPSSSSGRSLSHCPWLHVGDSPPCKGY